MSPLNKNWFPLASFGDYLGSAIDANGNQYVAVATNAAQQIYMFTRGPSSWNSELVISQTTLTENSIGNGCR